MVDFRNQLRLASFRGLSFHWVDDNIQAGRRIITHEIPGRDDPIHEDLGQLPRVLNVTAIIIGGQFVNEADAFEAALLKRGAGTLVHPHYGNLQTVVKSFQRQHSKDAIGEVAFGIVFERYGENIGIAGVSDSARKLSLSSASLFNQASTSFKDRLMTSGVPDYVLDDGLVRLNSFLSITRSVLNRGGIGGFSYPVFSSLTGGAGDEIVRLFRNVSALVKPVLSPVLGSATQPTAHASATALAQAMMDVAGNDVDGTSPTNNPSRKALRNNARAISDLLKQSALAAAAECCRYAAYTSRQEAVVVRQDMSDALTLAAYRMQAEGRVEDYRAITDVQVAVTEDINERLGRLPRTVMVRPSTLLPSLVLANRLYGDTPSTLFERSQDIATRNAVAHPGFMGAKPLEVVINE